MPRARLVDVTLLSYFLAALFAVPVVESLDALKTRAAPQIPAWLAAEYNAAVSQADPEEGTP